jgi:hypothetical protein
MFQEITRLSRLTLTFTLLFALLASVAPAQAESFEDWSFIVGPRSSPPSYCDSSGFAFYFIASWDLPSTGIFQQFSAAINGNIYFSNNVAQPFSGTGTVNAQLFGGANALPYTVTATWIYAYENEGFYYSNFTFTCTGSGITDLVFTNTRIKGFVFSGPVVPEGFVLRTIACDTPVFATPGGEAVQNARITAGQTWFVNPEPVEGADGQLWTEIFVSSYVNPYIPTPCVQ